NAENASRQTPSRVAVPKWRGTIAFKLSSWPWISGLGPEALGHMTQAALATFAENVRRERKRKNGRRKTLGLHAEYVKAVSRLERGAREPMFGTIAELGNALDVTPAKLLDASIEAAFSRSFGAGRRCLHARRRAW